MINFIVCDDDIKILKKVERIIDKYMMKNKLAYKVHLFTDYDDEFMQLLNSNLINRIYILDIEMPSRSGIDIARNIRIADINSVIIFLTSHEELGLTILKKELMFLSFINKYDDYEDRLNNSIKKSLLFLNAKNIIRIEEKGIIYTIRLDDIVYFYWDGNIRRTIIKTLCSDFKINNTLIDVYKMLDDRFIRTHKACFVNKDRVASIDKKLKEIVFNNGVSTDLLSNKYKNDLLEALDEGILLK